MHACIAPVTLRLKGILCGSSRRRRRRRLTRFPRRMCDSMSDVRLSNASPTLERVDARPADAARAPVRRSLFGSPDREGTRRYFAAALREDVQAFMDEYDFDPVRERPLPARSYDWQEDADAPEFFRRPPHHRRGAEGSGGGGGPPGGRGHSLGKRRSGDPGPCSSECQSKRSHTDDEEDEEERDGAGSQAGRAEEETRSRPEEESAEVQ